MALSEGEEGVGVEVSEYVFGEYACWLLEEGGGWGLGWGEEDD